MLRAWSAVGKALVAVGFHLWLIISWVQETEQFQVPRALKQLFSINKKGMERDRHFQQYRESNPSCTAADSPGTKICPGSANWW